MSQAPQQQKNRFQLSREVQESFVNSLAETMLSLAEQAGKVEQGWSPPSMGELPFCPVTGKEYSGANMVRLMLTGMEKGYADNRWMTFNQLQEIKDSHPDLKGNIRDYANVSQLVCLSNLENLNAVFINEGMSQAERLTKLNAIAISQMEILTQDHRIEALEAHSEDLSPME